MSIFSKKSLGRPESDGKIRPDDLIRQLGIEGLCQTADRVFQTHPDPLSMMAKPFATLLETPQALFRMGLMLSGLRLAKTMVVMDFGCGPCWFSRFMNQLQLVTISVDVSHTALKMGEKLFEEYPIIGKNYVAEPRFIKYDGHKIGVEDESVDRVLCFDSFHHVPNQEEVLREFFRVLKPGGIAGFSEPGEGHSLSTEAQYEMQQYGALENDVSVRDIKKMAVEIGYSQIYFRTLMDLERDLSYKRYVLKTFGWRIRDLVKRNIFSSRRAAGPASGAVFFFLVKGGYTPDSRVGIGLSHNMNVARKNYMTKVNEPVSVSIEVENSGTARWLHTNTDGFGVAKIGGHLYDRDHKLLNRDFLRCGFEKDINPGEKINKAVTILFKDRGRYYVSFDMVSELVCWFETSGSRPQEIQIDVE